MQHSALIIRDAGQKTYSLMLREVLDDDDFYEAKSTVTASENPKIRHLIDLCELVNPETLYSRVSKGRNITMASFYKNASEPDKKYIKSIVDKHVADAVKTAWQVGVHLFYNPSNTRFLPKKEELFFCDEPQNIVMHFKKDEEGTEYTLTLGNNNLKPSSHSAKLICETPSLFIIDNKIMTLKEGLSGKLLIPFLSKETTFIPKRTEKQYFRNFILKSAYLVEIDAEGFDVIEHRPDCHASLTLEKNIASDFCAVLRFSYDNHTFEPSDKRNVLITIEEDGEDIRFHKLCRNIEKEHEIRNMLLDVLNMPQSASLDTMIEWLRNNGHDLKELGVEYSQPSDEHYFIGDVRITDDESQTGDWFQLSITLHFDNGMTIPLTALKKHLLTGQKEYTLPDGSIFVIPDTWFGRYASPLLFGTETSEGKIRLHKSQHLSLRERKEDDNPTTSELTDRKLPSTLNATLRDYQREGYEWLLGHYQANMGCCLSDEMGLGKTVQTIALILKYKELTSPQESFGHTSSSNRKKKEDLMPMLFSFEEMTGQQPPSLPVLVIAPASVVYNWRNELHRFAPSLSVMEYVGTVKDRQGKYDDISSTDVVLTTYHTLRNDISQLKMQKYGILVFDESQMFKNAGSQIYDAVFQLQSDHRIALSGTPIENALTDLWSLMSILNPLLLGDAGEFRKTFINPITRDLMDEKTELLRRLVAPFFLKRTKKQVLDNLPERQDEIVYCEMGPQQQFIYETELSKARNELLDDTKQNQDTLKTLAAITRLRQIACAPALAGYEDYSGKVGCILDRLAALRGTEHKVLLFSEYVSFLELIEEEIYCRKWRYAKLTGETKDREKVIERFQNDGDCQIFLISLKAGGVGLNLAQADYVFLLDPWWNSAAEEQAIARAHRIGQRHSVFVYRFISKGTLEEQILDVQDRKQSLVEAILPILQHQ